MVASTTAGSGAPFLSGWICTTSGFVFGQSGTPALIAPQLFTQPPISVIRVRFVNTNSGPAS